ncbi:MAG: hypothetical protein C3F13_04655 [Anaerolineales bacterium]|nr:MAG: hypothetical protein C3F13_04655 [Anaerolineales bacterium]
MVKSGFIIGAISLVFILGISIAVAPFCAPCLGIFFGLAAGYLAGVFDKPASSGESVRKGASAGAIAGAIGFLGGVIGGVLNSLLLNPANVEAFTRMLGIYNVNISQPLIWFSQIGFALCIGLFDIAWMAVLGIAGGALWYQVSGKNQAQAILPPQQPLPPTA